MPRTFVATKYRLGFDSALKSPSTRRLIRLVQRFVNRIGYLRCLHLEVRYAGEMGENKTRAQPAAVTEFLGAVADERRRADAFALCEMMRTVTGVEPVMWGPSIVGFGTHRYEYETGRKGETVAVGFSPRKQALAVYGLDTTDGAAISRLGNVTKAKGCLYFPNFAAIDSTTLAELIQAAFTARSVQP
jgi:hypothetical protein